MKTTFDMLCRGHILTETEAYELLHSINRSELNSSKIAAMMAFYIARPITLNELLGFKRALLDLCIPIKLDKNAIDVCGTGGDQKNTFNISTLSAIVLAASGIPVAKHGNYGSSSSSGSSDILNYLGYKFKNNSDDLNHQLNKYNICFMHAPLFHPALKQVTQQRKELGVRTFFNMLGPLVNPSNVSHRYIGVYDLEIARLYNYLLQQESSTYSIVHSLDGYDEVSLTTSFRCITKNGETNIEPNDLGFKRIKQIQIYGGDTIQEAAKIFIDVLNNESSAEQKNVIIANSAMAMHCYQKDTAISECVAICKETIESKKAKQLFKQLISN